MKKEELEKLLTYAISTGADFAELYLEDTKESTYRMVDSKLDNIETRNSRGIGIRVAKNDNIYYSSTNSNNIEKIKKLINTLIKNIEGNSNKKVTLDKKTENHPIIKIPHESFPIEKKKKYLLEMDKTAKEHSKHVTQVSAAILEIDRNFTIANSEGKYTTGSNTLTRIFCNVYVEKDGKKEKEFTDYAGAKGYEILEEVDFIEKIKKTTDIAIEKIDAINFKGGKLPVIIKSGFGAVIFHEACGHGLEATSVATESSVFTNDRNNQIASKKVTLIDDGTIENSWGGNIIDDEGAKTEKNILIENGILTNYLIDKLNSKKMNLPSNGCGRRENYNYAPTSRMSNTYLAPGTDKVEDMIKSIKLGVYCERMSGGSVTPETGEFNFAVETARLIENGRLTHRIKGITLIGTSKEILKNVEMVSSDLILSAGYCGSKSGMIPVTIGQPTIKVSSILVGGQE